MGFCLSNSYCKDHASSVNIHISVGFDNISSRLINSNSKKNYYPQYAIQDIGYNIKINLIFFCNSNILKNSYTYKFQLFVDNSDIEELKLSYVRVKLNLKNVLKLITFFLKDKELKYVVLKMKGILIQVYSI